ncbi:Cupredoxin, partial [Rhexocercosporidium sp. MPI-PUGE-AT-0058]
RIEVGKGGIVFNPNTATAAVGDVVEFHFYPKNHSVTQGDFDSPCGTGSVTNGFFSGYVPSASEEASNVFQITIADTNPIWYYCSQGEHCASGMVGVINPPASGNSLAAYMAAAAGSTKVTTPAQVQGGSLVSNDES